MNIILLTQVTGFLKPFAWIMGVILNAIYEFFSLFGIENIALCILLFTLVIKMLMLPLTIKQQKFTKLSALMNPEIQKIQAKYKGKKDNESLTRMQQETQAVYQKYGTSQFGGCLPLLISLPIMFALYRVIYAVPGYITQIGDLYRPIAEAITNISGHVEELGSFITSAEVKNATVEALKTYAVDSPEYTNNLIDILYKFTSAQWDAFFNLPAFAALKAPFAGTVEEILASNAFLGLSVLDTPSFSNIPSLLIPVLAVASQYAQTYFSGTNTNANKDDPAAASSQAMMKFMPLLSGVFCFMFPICVGIYWIASAVFQMIQTIFINRYIDKVGLDAIAAKNAEKMAKRNKKYGIDYGTKMAEVAKTTTKTYETQAVVGDYDNTSYKKNNKRKSVSGADYKRSTVSYSSKSIAANANLLKPRDEEPAADKPAETGSDENKTEE